MTDFGAFDLELVAGARGENRDEGADLLVEHEYRPARDAPMGAGGDVRELDEVGVLIDD